MCANYTNNAVGETTHIEYIKTTNCSESNPTVWFSENKVPSIRGETMSRTNTLASETYTYDTLGRLTEIQETPAGEYCKTRTYTYDEESNRTNQTTREPNSKKECATEGGTEQKHTYDEASRLTDSGIDYDPWETSQSSHPRRRKTRTEKHLLRRQRRRNTRTERHEERILLDPNGRTRETITGTKKIDHPLRRSSEKPSHGPAKWLKKRKNAPRPQTGPATSQGSMVRPVQSRAARPAAKPRTATTRPQGRHHGDRR